MYRETLKSKDLVNKSKLSQEQVANKVNRISDAFLAVLEQQQYKDEHLQNIITSHVSKVPPALEAGLEMIGRLQCKWRFIYYTLSKTNRNQRPKTPSRTKLLSTSASLQTSISFTTRH
jgi:hypothetical protein